MRILVLLVMLAGCSEIPPRLTSTQKIDMATEDYLEVADKVQLGDSLASVLAILMPGQGAVSAHNRKTRDNYIENGVLVEIHYLRTGRQPDGFTTDDEFTPYIFNDGRLVGIGWKLLGGPTSRTQTIR